jgi:hypothetical protein
MKKIIALLITGTFFMACDNVDTANVSEVLPLPTIEVLGANPVFVPQGGTFTDPGAKALAADGATVLPYTSSVNGVYRRAFSINTANTNEYLVTYSALNIPLATRKVIVYKTGNLVNSIEGVYVCSVKRNSSNPVTAQNIKYVHIWKNSDGTFGISDAFGGWYEYHRGFGSGYITPGGKVSAINIATNTFTFPGNPLTNLGFGGVANLTSMTVNPTTKTIVFTTTWITGPSSYLFTATLTQVQL